MLLRILEDGQVTYVEVVSFSVIAGTVSLECNCQDETRRIYNILTSGEVTAELNESNCRIDLTERVSVEIIKN